MSSTWVPFIIGLLALVLFAMLVKRGHIKGFWNDEDGFSITDCLAGIFTYGYFLISGIMVQKLVTDSLSNEDLAFFQYFSWPVMTILGGYFGDKIMERFTTNRPASIYNNTYLQQPTYLAPNQPTQEELERRV